MSRHDDDDGFVDVSNLHVDLALFDFVNDELLHGSRVTPAQLSRLGRDRTNIGAPP